jgi:sterol desaturase/sphingolipid hydroxylase (fatty acid hydroxylase superfamily)
MIAQYVDQLKAGLHATILGHYAWLDWFVASIIDFLTGPFTGLRTRTYWPEVVFAVAIAAIVFVARDRRPGEKVGSFLRYLFPRRVFIHQSTWVDCKLILANHFVAPAINVTWRLGTPLFVGALLGLLTKWFGPAPHLFEWSTASLVIFTVLWGLADDFGYYVFHILSHRVPVLWAFHKVHHSAETLQVFANVRVHPIEIIVTPPFKAAAASLVIAPALYLGPGDAPFATILGMNVMVAFYGFVGAQLHHSHIWISWGRLLEHVFISPAMHQIHHSTAERHWDRNMGGNFALWDWIFDTIYVPHGREELTFGLGGAAVNPHPTLLAAYLVPFMEIMPSRERMVRWLRPIFRRLPPAAEHPVARAETPR